MRRDDVRFASAGTSCAAWLYHPEGGPRPAPCVVLAHGFSAVRDQRLDAFAERFARAGLAALAFDYRHFGGSDGVPRQLVDVARQLEDWGAAVAFARSLDGIDPARIAAWGGSLGGGHVMVLAARDPRLAAVVAHVPFTDGLISLPSLGARQTLRLVREALRDRLRAMRRRPPHLIPVVGPTGTVRVLGALSAAPGFRAITPPGSAWRNEVAARVTLQLGAYRPARQAKRIRSPILFCLADDDDLTAPGLALKAAGRAPRAEVRRYPCGHFDVFVGAAFERAVADQTEFLTRHLIAAGPLHQRR